MLISYAVVGHTSRQTQAETLAANLGAALALDDGTLGEGRNHDRAWAHTIQPHTDWSVVLEDDAQPIEDFPSQLRAALGTAPTPIVSLYLGTSRPPQYQRRIQRALQRSTHWIVGDELLHHVAVAIRTDLVPSMLEAVQNSTLPADFRIGQWARDTGLQVSYTNPSLVDHADTPSVTTHQDGQPRTEPRKAWTVGTRTQWEPSITHL